MKRVVMFSGGIGSWAAARRVVENFGTDGLILLFTDTLIEDEDLYRFLEQAAADIGVPVTRIADGRTPWQVFRDERYLGNARHDPCSKLLKRLPAMQWLERNCVQSETVVYLGMDWTESHRFDRARARAREQGWQYQAPLCEPPYVSRSDLFDLARQRGLTLPRLYSLGFSHNNCGGFCCKAGQGHFARLLEKLPDRYLRHEAEEQLFRSFVQKDVAMLVDRRGGGSRRPLTLERLRQRIESGERPDRYDIGGCGCFTDG